tara:strand:- start:725 stop:865 length:141 start_codon:yes stop_codon:yes gene_type:complete
MKKQNFIVKETIQREYENIFSRSSKLLAEFFNSLVIELDEVYAYDS